MTLTLIPDANPRYDAEQLAAVGQAIQLSDPGGGPGGERGGGPAGGRGGEGEGPTSEEQAA